jgi:ribosomal protein L39E
MKEIAQQEREIPVFDEIERKLGIQRDMFKREWRNCRYDYYWGDWRYDWHEERKVNQATHAKIQIKAN